MNDSLPYDENKFEKIVTLQNFLNIPDHSDIGFFVEVDLQYQDEIMEKRKNIPFCPKIKDSSQDIFSNYTNEM